MVGNERFSSSAKLSHRTHLPARSAEFASDGAGRARRGALSGIQGFGARLDMAATCCATQLTCQCWARPCRSACARVVYRCHNAPRTRHTFVERAAWPDRGARNGAPGGWRRRRARQHPRHDPRLDPQNAQACKAHCELIAVALGGTGDSRTGRDQARARPTQPAI